MENMFLRANYETGRCGVVDEDNNWVDEGLHCGKCFQVLINDKWINTRIELNDRDFWYLVRVPKPFDLEIQGLPMRFY